MTLTPEIPLSQESASKGQMAPRPSTESAPAPSPAPNGQDAAPPPGGMAGQWQDDAGNWISNQVDKGRKWFQEDLQDGQNFFRDSFFPYWDERLNFSGTQGDKQGIENVPVEQAPGGDKVTTVNTEAVEAQAEAAERQLEQQRDPNAEVDPQVDPYLEELRKRRADTTVGGRERLSEFLMATGIGMMASDDPDTLRNLGEGGMQGLEALQNLKQDERARLQSLDQQEGAYTRQVSSNEAALRKAMAGNTADPYKAMGDYKDAWSELGKLYQKRQEQLEQNPEIGPEEAQKIIEQESQTPGNPIYDAAIGLQVAKEQARRHNINIPEQQQVPQLNANLSNIRVN